MQTGCEITDRKERMIINAVRTICPYVTDDQVRSFMYADWNDPKHGHWLETAPVREIASWVAAGL